MIGWPVAFAVRGGVLRRRGVAAADVPALGAPAQVQPPPAGGVALHAAGPARRHRRVDARHRQLIHCASASAGGERQPDPEPGVAGHRLDLQIPVVLVHDDAPGDVEPEPGALAHRLGGEERLEDPLAGSPAAPRAGVADLDEQLVPVQRRCARSACPSRPSPTPRCRSGWSTPGSARPRRRGSRAAAGRSP